MRPNYFLALRVADRSLHQLITELQQSIVESNADLQPCIVSPDSAHVTIGVLTAKRKEDFENIARAMEQAKECIKDMERNHVQLTFSGLNTFKEKVLYVDVNKDNAFNYFLSLVAVFRVCFKEVGVPLKEEGGCVPHLTVWKMSKNVPAMNEKGIRRIPEETYIEHANKHFGSQRIDDIALCSMETRKAEDGYYQEVAVIKIESDEVVFADDYNILPRRKRSSDSRSSQNSNWRAKSWDSSKSVDSNQSSPPLKKSKASQTDPLISTDENVQTEFKQETEFKDKSSNTQLSYSSSEKRIDLLNGRIAEVEAEASKLLKTNSSAYQDISLNSSCDVEDNAPEAQRTSSVIDKLAYAFLIMHVAAAIYFC